MTDKKAIIWIIYTTQYRDGGQRLQQVARTMAREKCKVFRDHDIICQSIEDKASLVKMLDKFAREQRQIREFHFVGHAGMYGPMFGTTDLPEQFSPFEWRNIVIPFTKNGTAAFHACRSARWFAPFFSKTFNVPAFGYHWYTSFSKSSEKFVFASKWAEGNLYLMGCPGKKSHGFIGSFGKHSGLISHEAIKKFMPPVEEEAADASYDPVAELYDKVFEDIKVRKDEWKWLKNHLPSTPFSMLDIGSGNGAMLRELSPQIEHGAGVDLSKQMVAIASQKSSAFTNLSFQKIDGPILPFDDNSFDVVTSFLSFRYLDWDPIMKEIVRILKPGGKFLMIDMVTAPVKLSEFPNLIRSKAKQVLQHRLNPSWKEPLKVLSKDPRWAQMLALNPIRSDHEMRWYLESRFKNRHVEMLNVGWQNRVLAFDTGPIFDDYIPPQSYP